MTKREEAVVGEVFYGIEDHGILTCSLGMHLGASGGSYQSFGNICLDKENTGPDFKKALAEFFGCSFDAIKGQKCYALRCFSGCNEGIEGLELENGRRFILTEWRRRHWPKTPNPLEARRASLVQQIDNWTRRVQECSRELAMVESDYTEWT